jgi:SRSO17 transposase
MNLSKDEKTVFLASGGILLRTQITKKDQVLIKKKTMEKDWHTHLTCTSIEMALNIIDKLCTNHPNNFKKDE